MVASNRDPFSPKTAGSVAGSASREGLSGTRAYSPSTVKAPETVARDSGTNGLGNQRAGTPINPMAKNWKPLSDMRDAAPVKAGPNSSEKLVGKDDSVAEADMIAGKSTIGSPPGAGQANVDIVKGTIPNRAGRDLQQREGQAVGGVRTTNAQGISRASEGGYDTHLTGSYDPHTKGANLSDRSTGRPQKGDSSMVVSDE